MLPGACHLPPEALRLNHFHFLRQTCLPWPVALSVCGSLHLGHWTPLSTWPSTSVRMRFGVVLRIKWVSLTSVFLFA